MSEFATRLAAHAKQLIETGAPHQQQLAQDIQSMLQRFDTLRDNVSALVDEKAELARQVSDLKAQLGAMPDNMPTSGPVPNVVPNVNAAAVGNNTSSTTA